MKTAGFGRWILKNPGWRLLSILLAVVIWMNVATEPEMSGLITVPVQFKDPPSNLEVTMRASEVVQLEARGSSGQLRDLATSRPVVTLDFSGVREPGEKTFSITRTETNLPRAVELVRATPAQIRFRFERSARRTIPVTVRFQGQPPNGLHVESFLVEPAEQQIAGPESRVRGLKEALTDAVDLASINTAKPTASTAVYLTDPQVRFVSQPRVTVKLVLK